MKTILRVFHNTRSRKLNENKDTQYAFTRINKNKDNIRRSPQYAFTRINKNKDDIRRSPQYAFTRINKNKDNITRSLQYAFTINKWIFLWTRILDTYVLWTWRALRVHLKKKSKKRNDLSQCDKSTNRGLISEDRSTEATLLFTIPRSCLSRLHRIYLWKY